MPLPYAGPVHYSLSANCQVLKLPNLPHPLPEILSPTYGMGVGSPAPENDLGCHFLSSFGGGVQCGVSHAGIGLQAASHPYPLHPGVSWGGRVGIGIKEGRSEAIQAARFPGAARETLRPGAVWRPSGGCLGQTPPPLPHPHPCPTISLFPSVEP